MYLIFVMINEMHILFKLPIRVIHCFVIRYIPWNLVKRRDKESTGTTMTNKTIYKINYTNLFVQTEIVVNNLNLSTTSSLILKSWNPATPMIKTIRNNSRTSEKQIGPGREDRTIIYIHRTKIQGKTPVMKVPLRKKR